MSRVMADATVYRKVVDRIHKPRFLSNFLQAQFTKRVIKQPLQSDEKAKTVGEKSRKRGDVLMILGGVNDSKCD